ncbi:MAG TPA: branched-chain amino acid ABC transporter permease [Candidatus Nanoarchaeia archaeon]|nr:branched-chain amino acid ABC transporter permease [Candidatus Nanoarchaeia archaeon]
MILPYIIHLLIFISIYTILTVSLNLTLGFTGMLNLGHIAFFGIGAYTSTLLVMNGVPYIIAFLAAGIIAGIFGYLLVYAVRKLKGDYLALATLGFSFVMTTLFLNWSSLTRGPLGIPGIPRPEIFGFIIKTPPAYLLFVAVIAIIICIICWRITTSSFGTLLTAVRDDQLGLQVLGKNVFLLKAKAMILSACFAGIAGSLFAHYLSFIDPGSFTLTEIILVFTIVIVGGIASIKGSIIATFVIILLPELLRFLALPSAILGPLRQVLYALLLLIILLYRPRGLYGRIDLE